jgi:flagellar basal body-associated protein FliL
MEAEDSEQSVSEPKAPNKSKLGLVLAIVAVTVLVTGAAVAGTLFGPALLGRGKSAEHDAPAKEKGKEKEKGGKEAEKVGESVEFPPIMVDARAENGELHHIKLVIVVEVAEGTPKEELMRYAPRGREAAVAFMRSESFDKLSAPAGYAEVRAELCKKFAEAVGEERVARVLVTDFVAQ